MWVLTLPVIRNHYGRLTSLWGTSSALEFLSRALSPQLYVLSDHLIFPSFPCASTILFSLCFSFSVQFTSMIPAQNPSLRLFPWLWGGVPWVTTRWGGGWMARRAGSISLLSTCMVVRCTWLSLTGAVSLDAQLKSQTSDQLVAKRTEDYLGLLKCFEGKKYIAHSCIYKIPCLLLFIALTP